MPHIYTPPFPEEDAEDFHRSRRMFAVVADVLYIAPPERSGSHESWLLQEDLIDSPRDGRINGIVRGFVDESGVYFYSGEDFSAPGWAERLFFSHAGEIQDKLSLPDDLPCYGGMIPQPRAERWPPRKAYGMLGEVRYR